MQELRAAIERLEAEGAAFLDLKELASLVDRLQGLLCQAVYEGKKRGDNLIEGKTPCGWVKATCRLSAPAAAERLRVGEQLEAMPRVAEAMRSGEIGYQSTAVICGFRDKLRQDLRENINEEWWVEQAKESAIENLRWPGERARYVVDAASIAHQLEEDAQ